MILTWRYKRLHRLLPNR